MNFVILIEQNWTEDVRQYTMLRTLKEARRARGYVLAPLALEDVDPLPAEVAAVAVRRFSLAEAQTYVIYADWLNAPLDHLRFRGLADEIAGAESKTANQLRQILMDKHAPVVDWASVVS